MSRGMECAMRGSGAGGTSSAPGKQPQVSRGSAWPDPRAWPVKHKPWSGEMGRRTAGSLRTAETKRLLGALCAWRRPTEFETICEIKNAFEEETRQPSHLGHMSESKCRRQMRCGHGVLLVRRRTPDAGPLKH